MLSFYYETPAYPVYMVQWIDGNEHYTSATFIRTIREAKRQAKDMGYPCRVVRLHKSKTKPIWYSK